MTYDRTQDYREFKNNFRHQVQLATLPLVLEGIGLIVDSIKELRAEIESHRISRVDCDPLERQIRVKRLQQELEMFDEDREERKANLKEQQAIREEAALDRKERAAERKEAAAIRKRSLAEYTSKTNGYSHVD